MAMLPRRPDVKQNPCSNLIVDFNAWETISAGVQGFTGILSNNQPHSTCFLHNFWSTSYSARIHWGEAENHLSGYHRIINWEKLTDTASKPGWTMKFISVKKDIAFCYEPMNQTTLQSWGPVPWPLDKLSFWNQFPFQNIWLGPARFVWKFNVVACSEIIGSTVNNWTLNATVLSSIHCWLKWLRSKK